MIGFWEDKQFICDCLREKGPFDAIFFYTRDTATHDDAILFHVTRTTRELCAGYASGWELKSVKNQLPVKNCITTWARGEVAGRPRRAAAARVCARPFCPSVQKGGGHRALFRGHLSDDRPL